MVDTEWLREDAKSDIEVLQYKWTRKLTVHKATLSMVIISFAFLFVCMVYLGIVRKRFMFPLDPQSLENSLYFLCQSRIIDMLDEMDLSDILEDLDQSSEKRIHALHARVEVLDQKFAFGTYAEHHRSYGRFGVDVAEELDIEIISEPQTKRKKKKQKRSRRYRDDESVSGSPSEDEGSSNGDDDHNNNQSENSEENTSDEDEAEEPDDRSSISNGSNTSPQELFPERERISQSFGSRRYVRPATLRLFFAERSLNPSIFPSLRSVRRLFSVFDFPSTKSLPKPGIELSGLYQDNTGIQESDFPSTAWLPEPDCDGRDDDSNHGDVQRIDDSDKPDYTSLSDSRTQEERCTRDPDPSAGIAAPSSKVQSEERSLLTLTADQATNRPDSNENMPASSGTVVQQCQSTPISPAVTHTASPGEEIELSLLSKPQSHKNSNSPRNSSTI